MNRQTHNPKAKHTDDIDLTSATSNMADSLKSVSQKDTVVREIKFCLTSCSLCTGMYIDTINGKMLKVICRHSCHSTRA
jgi:hypothetical protein